MAIRRIIYAAAILLVAILLLSQHAKAQENTDTATRLRAAIDAESAQPGINTVLVFTNLANAAAKVGMKAWDSEGEPAGSFELEVPANGLAFVLASDIVDQTEPHRFIGKVESRARGHLTGSAILVGGPVTDLPAINRVRRVVVSPNTASRPTTQPLSETTFPVVAAF